MQRLSHPYFVRGKILLLHLCPIQEGCNPKPYVNDIVIKGRKSFAYHKAKANSLLTNHPQDYKRIAKSK
jgi:hypothetical protein